MDQEEAVKIFDLVVKGQTLPETLDKLVPLSFIGSAAVKFYQAKVKLLDQLGMSEEQRKATLADGQDAGEMLLNIEARIGELLPSPEEAMGQAEMKRGVPRGSPRQSMMPEGVTHKRATQSRAIKANPAAVAAVIKEARENEDIPTKTAVLNHIKYEKEKGRQKKADGRKIPDIILNLEQKKYINALYGVLNLLPTVPPKNWNEKSFAHAQSIVRIILKRLEAFDGKAEKYIAE